MNAITKFQTTTTKLNNGSCIVDDCDYLSSSSSSPENTITGSKIEIEFAGKSLEALFTPEKPEGVILEGLEFFTSSVDIDELDQDDKQRVAQHVARWLESQVEGQCIEGQEYLANAIEEEFDLLVA